MSRLDKMKLESALDNPILIDRWFLTYVAIFPIIDVFNGWLLLNNHPLPLGVIYRLGLFVFSWLVLIQKKKLRYPAMFRLIVINFMILSIVVCVQAIYFNNNITTLFDDFSYIVKYLLLILICFVFCEFPLHALNQLKFIIKIDVFLVLGLLIPYILGIGNYTYQNSNAGFKGFYFATNDITYAFVLITTLLAYSLQKQYKDQTFSYIKLQYVLILLNLLCLFLLSTKVGLLYILFILIYLFISLVFLNDYVHYHTKFLLFYISMIFSLFMLFLGYKAVLKVLDSLINRIQYFYYNYDGNLIRLITSSRSEYLVTAYNDFLNFYHNHIVLFFGFGFSNRVSLFGRAGNIEMDLFDILFSFGIVGFFLIVLTLVSLFKYIKTTRKNVLVVLLTVFYSFFAGHILFSGMSTVVFGMVLGQMFDQKEEYKCLKY